jgi:hypothetical protein
MSVVLEKEEEEDENGRGSLSSKTPGIELSETLIDNKKKKRSN